MIEALLLFLENLGTRAGEARDRRRERRQGDAAPDDIVARARLQWATDARPVLTQPGDPARHRLREESVCR